MPRGYRCIILAAFGIALACAAPSQGKRNDGGDGNRQSEIAEGLRNVTTAVKEANPPKKEDSGCDAGKDNRSSDLCAQWKAADAAAESATWTARTFWLGVGGATIGFLTLFAAGFAAWYARDAAVHTQNANRIALSERRPWILIECFEASVCRVRTVSKADEKGAFKQVKEYSPDSPVQIIAKFSFKNIGDSPAYNMTYWTKRLRGQYQAIGQKSIYGENLEDFYSGIREESSKIFTSCLMPGDSALLTVVIIVDDDWLSEPTHAQQPNVTRMLPRYSMVASYQGNGIKDSGESGKTFMFSFLDGDSPVDPLSFDQNSNWTVNAFPIMTANHAT